MATPGEQTAGAAHPLFAPAPEFLDNGQIGFVPYPSAEVLAGYTQCSATVTHGTNADPELSFLRNIPLEVPIAVIPWAIDLVLGEEHAANWVLCSRANMCAKVWMQTVPLNDALRLQAGRALFDFNGIWLANSDAGKVELARAAALRPASFRGKMPAAPFSAEAPQALRRGPHAAA